jgi:hypothetical protein
VPFSVFRGKRVTVSVSQVMLGIPLSNTAIGRIKVIG